MTDQPFGEHVELEHGGDLNITRFGDGQIRFSYERDGVRFGFPLTSRDLRGLRIASGGVVLADHVAGFDS